MSWWVEVDGSNQVTASRHFSDDNNAPAGALKVDGNPPERAEAFNGGTYNPTTKRVSGVPVRPPSRREELKAKDTTTWTEQDKLDAQRLLNG